MREHQSTRCGALLVAIALAAVALAGTARVGAHGEYQTDVDAEIQVLPIRGHLYMLVGAGGNITASIGPDGILLVDSGRADMSEKVLAALERLQKQLQEAQMLPRALGWGAETRGTLQMQLNPHPPHKPIRYILNTHVHPDHTGGNERLAQAGRTFTGGNVAGSIADATEGAAIVAHENVLARMSAPTGGPAAAPFRAWPTETYYIDAMKMSHFFNGEGIQLLHQPAAHSDGDSLVYFRGSDVIAAGDLYVTTSYPVIDLDRGGNIEGVIAGLNRILALAIPEFRTEGGTLVVPGHGRLSDSADVGYYRDMVTIIRDRVQAMISKGMTLEQVKAARPTLDYDPRYGSDSGSWTTDMFVEAVYRSLAPGTPTLEEQE